MESRRSILRAALFGVAAVGLPTAARAAQLPEGARAPDALRPEERLFAPLVPHAALGLGWSFVRSYAPVQGAITVNLAHADGRQVRVDVCLRESTPRGPASTEYLDFVVMDGGDGSDPLDEPLGRVVRRLAAIAAANESALIESFASLEPHDDRVWRHADALGVAARQLQPGLPQEGGA